MIIEAISKETNKATNNFDFGPVRRWTDEDGIMYAENDWLLLAWAYTDDPAKVGTFGWHGPKQIGVEYILRPKA